MGQAIPDDLHLLVVAGLVQEGRILFDPYAFMDEQCRITAVIDDQIRPRAVRPGKGLFGAPPILLQRLAFPGKYRRRLRLGYRRGSMILSGEDIARSPAEIGSEYLERLDQHGRLNGHVETARDFQPLQGFFPAVFLAKGHQAGHFVFGESHLLPTPGRQCWIGDAERKILIQFQKFHGFFSLRRFRAFCRSLRYGHSAVTGGNRSGSRFRTGGTRCSGGVTMPAEMIRVKASSTVMFTSISSSLGIMTKTPVVGVRAQGM